MATTSPRGRLEFESDSSGESARDPATTDARRAVRDAELRADLARLRLTLGWVLALTCAMCVVDLIMRLGIEHRSATGMVALRLGDIAYVGGTLAFVRRQTVTARQLTVVRAVAFLGFAMIIALQCAVDRGAQSILLTTLVALAVLQAMTSPMPLRAGLPRVLAVTGLGLALALALTAGLPDLAPQLGDLEAMSRFATTAATTLAAAVLLAVGGDLYWRLRRQVFARRLVGRYRLIECIGRGGMGEVWRASHPGLRRDVAIKILRGDRARGEQIARFQAEVAALSELSHPNTVRVYDSGVTDDGLCYYAMELLTGETLDARVRRAGPLAPADAAAVIGQIARALAEAHDRGIVHRDLSPANVFLDTSRGRERAKLIDFGIAKRTHSQDDGSAAHATVSGTPAYMAPEQAAGAPATPASDLYGLGGVWCFALTGRAPARVAPELPPDADPLVARCLAADPAARPAGARSLAAALGGGGGLGSQIAIPLDQLRDAADAAPLVPPTPSASASASPSTSAAPREEDVDPEQRASYVRLQTILRWTLGLWCALAATDVVLGVRAQSLGVAYLVSVRAVIALVVIEGLRRLRGGLPAPAMLAGIRQFAFIALAIGVGLAATGDQGPDSAACATLLLVIVAQGLAVPGRVRATLLELGATVSVFVATVAVGVVVRPPPAYHAVIAVPYAVAALAICALMAIVGKAHWALRQQLFEQRVVGRYKLQHMLGAGGMGEVWSAAHPGLGREVAIKLLRPDDASPERVARFETEVAALTTLAHPHTVRVYDCGTTDDGFLYYVMERLHGKTLADAVEDGGALHGARAVRIARQIAAALADAHAAGIIHRDLKPDNVFLAREGADREHVKVIDFGIAKRVLESRVTRTGMAIGTPAFMSPEQAQCLEVDGRTDVYALGALLFYMLTSRPPFTAESAAVVMLAHVRDDAPRPSQYAHGLPRALDDLVVRCLGKEPSERPASMAALAAELDELARAYDQLVPAAMPVVAAPAGGLVPIEDTPLARPAVRKSDSTPT